MHVPEVRKRSTSFDEEQTLQLANMPIIVYAYFGSCSLCSASYDIGEQRNIRLHGKTHLYMLYNVI